MNKLDLQYLAGLIDSRGSLICQKVMQPLGKNHNYLPMMSFHSKDSRRSKLIAKIFDMEESNNLQLGKKRTIELLKLVYPYLRYRKQQVKRLLELEDTRLNAHRVGKNKAEIAQPSLQRMDRLYNEFLTLRNFRNDQELEFNE